MSKIPRRPPDKTEPYHTRPSSPSTTNDVDITEVRDNFGSQERLVPPKQDSNPVFSQHVADTNVTKINWWERLLLTRDLWSPTWNIYLFCIIGIGFAIGHHAFYASLEGKIVHGDDQLIMLRYGTALAFAAKASFVASVMSAFREQIWATMRSKLLAIATLDDMFAAHETPFSLMNVEFLTNAKLWHFWLFMAGLSPLIVILTTNTLLVKPREEIQLTRCPSVRTLNFSQEAEHQWRAGEKVNGLYQFSLSLWNTTSVNTSDPNFLDYWAGPSDQGSEVFQAGTVFKRPFTNLEDTFTVCEKGWNCTIEIRFIGSGYKCQELGRGVGAKARRLHQESGEADAPFYYDPFKVLAPTGNFTWIADTGLGDYVIPQLNDTWPGGIPKMDPPFPKHLGAFRTEPVIVDSTIPALLEPNKTASFNPKAWNPVLIACEHYEVDYTAELRYIDGVQLHRIKDRKFLTPIVNTTFNRGVEANDDTMDNTTAVPESNYILPKDQKRYRRTAAYHAIGAFLRSMMNGTIYQPGSIANSHVLQTDLIDHKMYNPYSNIAARLERYYDTLLLSLLGNPRFVVNVWAAEPSIQTGTNNGSEYRYDCTRSRPATAYYYRARNLVLVHGVAAFFAILGVAAGTKALQRNGGISRNNRFSSLLAATRNESLNWVKWDGPQTDRGYISKDLMRQKLGYGLLKRREGNCSGSRESEVAALQYGFGFQGEVDQTPAVRSRRTFVTDEADG
ncbi:hypothetical protein CKAH01_07783 [Colletotrichum kahawae]|uniref:Formylmethionine deformylase-like protein n=1 Tax=Colletotrichum kahawae TaxID=34407 RepID=A0AAD9Y4Y0_COLKA|nr:hypothetical protein CKAH01_07783 [Colletotrichum kahawae]